MLVAESDEALAARAAGDREAFTELYRRYVTPVYRYMRYQAPTADAQDLTAHVFMQAYRCAHQFRGDGGGYRAWLFRIAHNTLVGYRRSAVYRPVPVDEVPDTASDDDPGERAAREETRRTVWAAVAALGPRDRELIELRYVEGLPHAEIAQVTGSSDGAVRVRIHRLLRRLRAGLEQRGVRR